MTGPVRIGLAGVHGHGRTHVDGAHSLLGQAFDHHLVGRHERLHDGRAEPAGAAAHEPAPRYP